MPPKKMFLPIPPEMEQQVWAESSMQPQHTLTQGALEADGSRPGRQELMHRPTPGSLVDQLYPKSEGWNPGVVPPQPQFQPPRNLVAELWSRYKSLQAKRKV